MCPTHQKRMRRCDTQYGLLFICDEVGCDIRCWAGPYTSPADSETRALRSECHKPFDPLWRMEYGPFHSYEKGARNSKRKKRGRAYAWLARAMQIELAQAHFGLFDKQQCMEATEKIEALAAGH